MKTRTTNLVVTDTTKAQQHLGKTVTDKTRIKTSCGKCSHALLINPAWLWTCSAWKISGEIPPRLKACAGGNVIFLLLLPSHRGFQALPKANSFLQFTKIKPKSHIVKIEETMPHGPYVFQHPQGCFRGNIIGCSILQGSQKKLQEH